MRIGSAVWPCGVLHVAAWLAVAFYPLVARTADDVPLAEAVTPAPAAAAAAAAAAATAPLLPEPARAGITAADIERLRAELDEAAGLSAEARTQAAEQFAKAIERLESTAQLATQIATLKAEADRAPQELARLEKLATTQPEQQPIPAETEPLRAAHREAEAAAAEARRKVSALTAEIERRTVRGRDLPELTTQARSRLETIAESLAAPSLAGEPPELVAARRLWLECARQYRTAELDSLEQETRTYAETARVLALERERAERTVTESGRRLAALVREVADRDQQEAEARAVAARRAAIEAHPAVREAAGVNTSLAEQHAKLVEATETARAELTRVETLRDQLAQQYAETRKRAEEARFSPAIGMMLRGQRAELPDTSAYRQRLATRADEQAEINFKLLEWETDRRRLQHADEAVAAHLDAVRDELGFAEQLDVREELDGVFRDRLALYADLITSARGQLGRLAALESAEEGLIHVVDEQRAFIAEHVLWVRSTTPLTPAMLPLVANAAGDLTDRAPWSQAWQVILTDIHDHPLVELLLIPPLWLLAVRRRLVPRLAELAHDAQRSSVTGFRPTLEAIAVSAGLAAPGPALLAFCGWRLTAVGATGDSTHALGKALIVGSAAFAALCFAAVACLPKGIGVAHFSWEQASTAAIRRSLTLVRWVCLPASIVCLFTEFSGDELLSGTIGRLALVTESLALAAISWRLFRPAGPVRGMLARHHAGAWLQIADRLWIGLFVALPLALAALSLAGYHYTATRLATRMAVTWGVLGLGIFVRSLALRWLLLVYRKLAVKRARERRADLQARQAGDGEPAAELPATDGRSLELRLADINEQSQRLVRLAVMAGGLACLAVIWQDIVPAVGYLGRFTLWNSGLTAVGEAGDPMRITLIELLFAGLSGIVTVLACRNLPGLLDLAVFQRLPLDAGARYAASAVTQYAVAVVGTVLCFRQLGIGWQSVQWLVAAMTVGLGFGLQEIFANFVSGIILLFERPIRVGDVVTIGDISGIVTRIQIRATTICDWDHKELIVPNRDFVTGKLVNWTLTNPNLRVVIKVGIAYGSDTRLVVRLLEEAAAAHPLTLADPPPIAVFSQFGSSSLDFELRVFAAGVVNARMLRHDLHLAIDDTFRTHGVEIAFPQQDLHVRSVPEGWPTTASSAAVVDAESTQLAGPRRVA